MDFAFIGILLITILVSFVVVRIGGFALQLTGIEPDVARFQALSAFSGTGFTTTEAERVVRHRTRRRIVTILIIMGNAGLVTMMATLVASFTQDGSSGFVSFFIKLAIIIAGILVFYSIIIRSNLGARILDRFRKPLMKRIIREAPAIDEIYHAGRDWGISLVMVKQSSKNIGLSLGEIMTVEDMRILEIERGGSCISNPDSEERVMVGDRLLVYGNKKTIRQVLVS